MPCRYDDYSPSQSSYESGKADAMKQMVPLLCEACTLLEEAKFLSKASEPLKKWYKEHEECESDRVRYEAALKLSERERRLLGINLEQLASKVKKK